MVLCVLLLTASLVTAGMEWSNLTEYYIPGEAQTSTPIEDPGNDALTYYTNQSTFESAHSGLTLEDWSNTSVPPGQVVSANGPWDYLTSNPVWQPGDIVEGIRMNCIPSGNLLVILTTGFLGVPQNICGSNTFIDGTEIEFFNYPVRAFGCLIFYPMGFSSGDIEIVGTSGSTLGTTTASGDLNGMFWGVYSDDEDIDHINFTAADGTLLGDLQFGYGLPLARTTWGSIKQIF